MLEPDGTGVMDEWNRLLGIMRLLDDRLNGLIKDRYYDRLRRPVPTGGYDYEKALRGAMENVLGWIEFARLYEAALAADLAAEQAGQERARLLAGAEEYEEAIAAQELMDGTQG